MRKNRFIAAATGLGVGLVVTLVTVAPSLALADSPWTGPGSTVGGNTQTLVVAATCQDSPWCPAGSAE